MAKISKNYRLSDNILKQLGELKDASENKTATDIIENLISFLHEEYTMAKQGKPYNSALTSQVLGKRNL